MLPAEQLRYLFVKLFGRRHDVFGRHLVENIFQFDGQVSRLEELRSRSVALLGFAAVVVGLLGVRTHVTHHTAHGVLVVVALVAFGVIAFLATQINRPVHWDDGEKLDQWLERIATHDPLVEDFELHLARALDGARKANADTVGDRARDLRRLCVALAVLVACGAAAVLL